MNEAAQSFEKERLKDNSLASASTLDLEHRALMMESEAIRGT